MTESSKQNNIYSEQSSLDIVSKRPRSGHKNVQIKIKKTKDKLGKTQEIKSFTDIDV